MKRSIAMVVAACTAAMLVSLDADAKRIGSGRSVGSTRDVATQRQMTPAPAATPAPTTPAAAAAPAAAGMPAAAAAKAAAPAAAQQGWRRWMGPIAGIAAGLGIAALMSHLGLSEAFGNFLLIALLVVAAIVVVRLIMSRKRAAQQPAQNLQYASAPAGSAGGPGAFGDAGGTAGSTGAFGGGSIGQAIPGTPGAMAGGYGAAGSMAGAAAAQAGGNRPYPAGFDPEPFLQQAKINFAELQRAYDQADTETLRDVMTPEMFAEISGDIAAQATQQPTVIVRLDAEILEVVTDGDFHWATVRFHGLSREDGIETPQPFDEAWNLRKAVDGSSGWLLAGIQQLQ